MVLSRTAPASLAGVALFALSACGSGAASGDGGPAIVATTSIWADITSEVACGAEIPAVIPAGADPHSYEPSLRDRELLEGAEVVIANGLGLEEPLIDLLDTVQAEQSARVMEVSIYVDVLIDDGGHDHDHDEHIDGEHHDDGVHDDGAHDDEHHDEHDDEEHRDEEHDDEHGHGADGDPHLWQDPRRVAGALDAIATAVAAEGMSTCVDEYRDELLALDAEIEQTLSVVPPSGRVLVTSHDSLGYFADRYDFEIVGTVIPGGSTLAETNAADLAALAEEIERHAVPAVFTERLESTVDADALAERLGIGVVPLVTDALLDDDDADTYVELMRTNATAIAAALAP